MAEKKMVTIVVHRDGELENRVYHLPVFQVRLLKVASVAFAVLIVVAAVSYRPVLRTAIRVPAMEQEIARLTVENLQVRQLSATLTQLEGRYDQMRTALGANVIPEVGALEDLDPFQAHPIHAVAPTFERGPAGSSLPTGWPLDSLYHPGVLTRGQIPAGAAEDPHPGIDIAVRSGTPILASGGGIVSEAGYDPDYGFYVLLGHPQGYATLYGHASRLLVAQGDSVSMSQVIALVGNTGRSTAPHLHFEKRRGDDLIDPLAELNQGS
jgi:murein DD-endopeptidase MepM/ murein hydrolase activator NlpD